jgi:excisionase family DNA binding protein
MARGAPLSGRLLTLADVADELGVSRSTVKRWTASGALPVFRHGRVVRVREHDLRAFVAARVERVSPGSAAPAGVAVRGRLWD